MEKNIKQFIEKYQLEREKKIILAISGGPDSMVLLNLMLKVLPKEKLVVAHANHGLRLEARWDENFVSMICASLGIDFASARLSLKTAAEAEARQSRYDFLEQVKIEHKANYILLGHHLNDQVETVLLSLIRGSGPLATWGMNEQEGSLLRPFLGVRKAEILKYAKDNHLGYHLDRSNFNIRYTRNRIRTKLLPQIEKINPGFLETLGRNAELGREMEEAWSSILADKQKKIYDKNGLMLARLKREPKFVQKELVRFALKQNLIRKDGFSSENVDKVMALIALSSGKKTEIGTLVIKKGPKYISFGKKTQAKILPPVKLELENPVSFGGLVLKMTRDGGRATKNNILLPVSIGYNLTIRTWRDGDRLVTQTGTKKLQDLFVDAKVPAAERRTWPVVVSGRKILWVPRIAACAEALSDSKRKVIKIEVRNERKKK